MTGVIRKRHRDEAVETAAKLEQLLGRQRRPIAQHVVGEDKQPAEGVAKERLPSGQALQIVAGRPVLPVGFRILQLRDCDSSSRGETCHTSPKATSGPRKPLRSYRQVASQWRLLRLPVVSALFPNQATLPVFCYGQSGLGWFVGLIGHIGPVCQKAGIQYTKRYCRVPSAIATRAA
jgi:hypothetical protein